MELALITARDIFSTTILLPLQVLYQYVPDSFCEPCSPVSPPFYVCFPQKHSNGVEPLLLLTLQYPNILPPIYSSSTFSHQNYTYSSKPPRKSQEICNLSSNYHEINRKLLTVNCYSLPQQAIIRRSHPAKYGEGFDAPPTLERSGSERRGGAVSLFFPEGRRPR